MKTKKALQLENFYPLYCNTLNGNGAKAFLK